MKLKELESLLQDVRPFEEAKVELEQYPTGPHLAACMLYTIESAHEDIEGRVVLDLGSGTGMLSIGCALLGASHVIGLELDADALEVAQDNVQQFEDPLPVDFVHCNVLDLLPGGRAAAAAAAAGGGGRDEESGRRGARGGRGGRRGGGGGRGRGGGGGRQRSYGADERGRRRRQADSEEEDDENEEEEDDEEGSDAEAGQRDVQSSGGPQEGQPQPALVSGVCPPMCASLVERLQPDTVVMNPPFGTKSSWGVDVLFLQAAAAVLRRPRRRRLGGGEGGAQEGEAGGEASPQRPGEGREGSEGGSGAEEDGEREGTQGGGGGCIYSLHKSSTRAHIHGVALRQLGARRADVVAELRYDLPATMKFHKQKSVDVQVDLWRIEIGDTAAT